MLGPIKRIHFNESKKGYSKDPLYRKSREKFFVRRTISCSPYLYLYFSLMFRNFKDVSVSDTEERSRDQEMFKHFHVWRKLSLHFCEYYL